MNEQLAKQILKIFANNPLIRSYWNRLIETLKAPFVRKNASAGRGGDTL